MLRGRSVHPGNWSTEGVQLHSTTLAAAALAVMACTLVAAPALAACDHPYFPIKQGEKYVYAQAGTGIAVTEVVSKVDGNHFTYDVTSSGIPGAASTSVVTGECSSTGFTINRAPTSRAGATVKILASTGSAFGTPEQMKIGGSWVSTLSIETESKNSTFRSDTKSTSRVVASERVKVPAGEFEALKIESLVEVTTTMSSSTAKKTPQMPTIKGKLTLWVVKGVGLVKSQSATEEGALSPPMELVSFSK
jgi:hypothetical protein